MFETVAKWNARYIKAEKTASKVWYLALGQRAKKSTNVLQITNQAKFFLGGSSLYFPPEFCTQILLGCLGSWRQFGPDCHRSYSNLI